MRMIVRSALLFAILGLGLGFGCSRRHYSLPPVSMTQIYPSIKVRAAVGRVVRSGSQEALSNVIVEVFTVTDQKPVRVGGTDHEGRFRFKLAPGSYVLQFSLFGYDRVRQPITISASGSPEILLDLPLGT